MTPTERLAAENADLAARLQLSDEALFFALARVRALEAQLGLPPSPTNT